MKGRDPCSGPSPEGGPDLGYFEKRLLDNGISNKELAEFMDAPKEVD